MFLDKKEVMSFLPHREPFLFIDSIENVAIPGKNVERGSLTEKSGILGGEVTALYRTNPEHPIFKGHFPGNPILPGVVQIEMMAQAGIFIFLLLDQKFMKENFEVALLSVSESKFRRPILPNMNLVIKTKCIKLRGPFVSSTCQVYCDDILMSEATMMATSNI